MNMDKCHQTKIYMNPRFRQWLRFMPNKYCRNHPEESNEVILVTARILCLVKHVLLSSIWQKGTNSALKSHRGVGKTFSGPFPPAATQSDAAHFYIQLFFCHLLLHKTCSHSVQFLDSYPPNGKDLKPLRNFSPTFSWAGKNKKSYKNTQHIGWWFGHSKQTRQKPTAGRHPFRPRQSSQ